MKAIRTASSWCIGAALFFGVSPSFAQVVINEFLVDERLADSGIVHPSTREFLELYNPGPGAVDISGWTLKTIEMGSRWQTAAGVTTYTIPPSTSIPANDYYVLGKSGVANLDLELTPALLNATNTPSGDLFPDGGNGSNRNFVFELRNAASALQDSVAVATTFGVERERLTPEQLAFTGGGIWPQTLSTNVPTAFPTFNLQANLSRYRDGLQTGANGRDFGFLPTTPGATNNLPYAPNDGTYVVPNVEALPVETPLGSNHGLYGSFVVPVVAEPHVLDGVVVQKATNSPPPVGTKAIMNYDSAGGGNTVASDELVNRFDIYAYIDTDGYNLVGTGDLTDTFFAEWTTYGIGTSDPFFSSFDAAGLQGSSFTRSGNTGVGWTIQKVERNFGTAEEPLIETRTVLQLVNFGEGGDSIADAEDPFPTWDVIESIDLSADNSDWHRLSIDYDPDTNMVDARYDDQTFTFAYSDGALDGDFNGDGVVDAADYVGARKTGVQGDIDDFAEHFGESGEGGDGAGLIGTFYVGYRDGLDDSNGVRHFELSRPATYLQYQAPAAGGGGAVPEPSTMLLTVLAFAASAATRRYRG